MKIAVVFDNFGPYHLARLQAANRVCTLLAVEISHRSQEYDWRVMQESRGFHSITLDRNEGAPWPRAAGCQILLLRALKCFGPDCVFLPGWSRMYSLAGLAWCRSNDVPAVLMSESTMEDLPRYTWKERLKKGIIARYSAALVGGSRHTEYLMRLGMSPDRIFDGYDVVDNDYFYQATEAVHSNCVALRKQFHLPGNFFLASARFIERKNLLRLVEAYAVYRRNLLVTHTQTRGDATQPWSLVLLGDGPQREKLQRLISGHKLQSLVLLPGFKQYSDLPIYYGLASAFLHASTSEPWGLVVNEAMASGLPVVVSDRCGCAPELVQDGRNGFLFDPTSVEQLAWLMFRISTLGSALSRMSEAGRETVSRWGPERFAGGLQAAASRAVALCVARRSGPRISISRSSV